MLAEREEVRYCVGHDAENSASDSVIEVWPPIVDVGLNDLEDEASQALEYIVD
jgi:hypothetical protein